MGQFEIGRGLRVGETALELNTQELFVGMDLGLFFFKQNLTLSQVDSFILWSHNVLKLRVIFLIQPAKCWDYGSSPSGVFGFILFHNSEVLEILHRH